MKRVNQAVIVACMILFVYFCAVQLNDADGWLWILLYGYAAGLGGASLFGRNVKWMAAAAAVGYFLGFVYLAPDQMSAWIELEEGREAMGLLVSSLYFVLLFTFTLFNDYHPSANIKKKEV